MDLSNRRKKKKSGLKIVSLLFVLLVLFAAGGSFALWQMYKQNLGAVSSSEQTQSFTVPTGTPVQRIASSLKDAKLIRSTWAFEWYVRAKNARGLLKAGTYNLSPNLSVSQIVNILTNGKIATDLVTILPGQSLDQIKQSLVNQYGFDEAAVDAALDPATYPNHPALADKPPAASLAGFLYPESFQKTTTTKPEDIIRGSLDEMNQRLTPAIKSGMAQQGLTVYQGIILASMVEHEVSSPQDRGMVTQVFLRRLREGRPLQSDASPYTYNNQGLPAEPISNVSSSSLEAVANPASTDFLYFVSGDDGHTYFSHTLEEHEAFTQKYCQRLCQ